MNEQSAGLRVMPSTRAHYVAQDSLTEPGAFAGLYDRLPAGVASLRDIVSQLIVHVAWSEKYAIPAGIPMMRETQKVADRLRSIQTAFPEPLDTPRPPHSRSFGTCRDYSLLLCSMLRHRKIPARVRCGFATYFPAAPYEDHWVCEYWSAEARHWCRVDAQLDELLRRELEITFDPADLPDQVYRTAGQAWNLVRSGAAAADDFGHGDARGLWFLNVDLHRDLLSLANRQTSAWDTWRSATARHRHLDGEAIAFGDHIAKSIETAEQSADGFSSLAELAARVPAPPWIDRGEISSTMEFG